MKAPCRRSGHEDKQRRQWKPTKETLDLEALIAADGRAPRFEESVDLWRDDLDPHSFGFFRVRVRAHERFWVAYSRFFIRVRVPCLLRLLDGASMASLRRASTPSPRPTITLDAIAAARKLKGERSYA